MKMRLHPAELGAVEISLERNSSGALSAHFTTENEGARQALTNNLDQLRDSLQKSGWQVGQLDVSSNSSSSTADQNREHRSRQNDVAGDNIFDHRSEKQEDLEQDPSSRLLNLRA
jgi:flagellar hook-length control protein FliK